MISGHDVRRFSRDGQFDEFLISPVAVESKTRSNRVNIIRHILQAP
jgi:hypothetical protein